MKVCHMTSAHRTTDGRIFRKECVSLASEYDVYLVGQGDSREECNVKVIGVGEMILTESTDGWVEFTLPLDYVTTSEVPTHIIIVFTGSRFGDYFTGSTQSLMLVDDLELLY